MFRLNIFLASLVVLCLNSSAQQAISNPAPNISLDNIRYLFVGVDNPVTITTGCDGKYEVSISRGSIIDQGKGHFVVRPPYDTSEVTIKVKTGIKEFDFAFTVRNIPDPEIMVGSYEGDPIHPKHAAGLRAFLKNFYYRTQFNVVSFDIEFSGPGFEDPNKHNNEGAQWDEVTKKAMSKMVKGSKVYINNVRVIGPDSRVRHIYDDLTWVQQ